MARSSRVYAGFRSRPRRHAVVRRFVCPPPPPDLRPGPVPTFSVVIAAYQASATIAETVESALAQTLRPREVIVVDDGSTDDTEARLRPYREELIYIRQENRGVAAATNVAVHRASGDFVAILNADDRYEPQRLAALRDLAVVRPDLDILVTDAYLEIDGKIIGRFCERTPFAVTQQNVAIFERCFVAWPAIRRKALISVGGFDESLVMGEDWECWIRLLHVGSRAGLVAEPLMRYRIGEQSLTANRVAALRSRVAVLEKASSLHLSPAERRALMHFLPVRRRRALLAEAEQALRERRLDARRRALRVALAGGMQASTRMRALAAAVAPGAAARRLGELEAQTGTSRIRRISAQLRDD